MAYIPVKRNAFTRGTIIAGINADLPVYNRTHKYLPVGTHRPAAQREPPQPRKAGNFDLLQRIDVMDNGLKVKIGDSSIEAFGDKVQEKLVGKITAAIQNSTQKINSLLGTLKTQIKYGNVSLTQLPALIKRVANNVRGLQTMNTKNFQTVIQMLTAIDLAKGEKVASSGDITLLANTLTKMIDELPPSYDASMADEVVKDVGDVIADTMTTNDFNKAFARLNPQLQKEVNDNNGVLPPNVWKNTNYIGLILGYIRKVRKDEDKPITSITETGTTNKILLLTLQSYRSKTDQNRSFDLKTLTLAPASHFTGAGSSSTPP
jgi:division protein CdvB (Snf7/Vps24/ESCRT-III family)